MKKFMNLKKITYTLISMFAVCLMTASLTACCSDDDDKASSSYSYEDVKGTWKWTSSYDTKGEQVVNDYLVGKYLWIISATDYETNTNEVKDGTYSLSGNKFIAHSTNGRIITATIKISGKNMTMEGTTNDGWTFKYTFVHEITGD